MNRYKDLVLLVLEEGRMVLKLLDEDYVYLERVKVGVEMEFIIR